MIHYRTSEVALVQILDSTTLVIYHSLINYTLHIEIEYHILYIGSSSVR